MLAERAADHADDGVAAGFVCVTRQGAVELGAPDLGDGTAGLAGDADLLTRRFELEVADLFDGKQLVSVGRMPSVQNQRAGAAGRQVGFAESPPRIPHCSHAAMLEKQNTRPSSSGFNDFSP
ncbi:MAG: hypothetical protein AB7P03_15585 [Kofleriaceae bacterium]